MVLSGVGDALGYRAGRWEYCTSGPQIHAELAQLGGLAAISLEPPEWPVSDDTVLHLATAEGLATGAGQKGLGWGPHGAPGWHYRGVCPLGVSPRGWGGPCSAPCAAWWCLGVRLAFPLQPRVVSGRFPLHPWLKLEHCWEELWAGFGASSFHFPPSFRGFQGGLGGCVSLSPLDTSSGGVGTVSLSLSVFLLIYLPFPPILGSGDKDNSPSHSENLAGYPFSHSL